MVGYRGAGGEYVIAELRGRSKTAEIPEVSTMRDKEYGVFGTVQREVATRQRETKMSGQPMDGPGVNEVAVSTTKLFQQ